MASRSVAGEIAAAVLAAVVVTAGAAPAPQAEHAGDAPFRLERVAWLAGDWQGEAGAGAVSQEVWAAPSGDCMMGMWRLVIEGRVRLFESLSITQEDGGPVLRLRHIGRDGVAWEERERPLTLPLVEAGDGLAVFAGPGRSGPLRIVYRRTGSDAMSVSVEKSGGTESFVFRRVSPWRGEVVQMPALAPAERP